MSELKEFVFVTRCVSHIYTTVRATDLELARAIYDKGGATEPDNEPVQEDFLLRVEDKDETVLWEPPVRCPRCGCGDIAYSEYVNRMYRTYEEQDGRVVFQTSSDKTNWEDNKDQTLWCNNCSHEFPIPADVEIEFE